VAGPAKAPTDDEQNNRGVDVSGTLQEVTRQVLSNAHRPDVFGPDGTLRGWPKNFDAMMQDEQMVATVNAARAVLAPVASPLKFMTGLAAVEGREFAPAQYHNFPPATGMLAAAS
jgi:hypothetical protein